MNKIDLRKFNEYLDRVINEDILKKIKDKKDAIKLKEEEDYHKSIEDFQNAVVKRAKENNYLNNIFKKYNFTIDDFDENVKWFGSIYFNIGDKNSHAGIDFGYMVDKGKILFELIPYDFTYFEDLGLEEPLNAYNKIFEGIFGFSSDNFRQENDFDKLIPYIEKYCGKSVADKAEKIMTKFLEDNYDEIIKEVEESKNESRKIRRKSEARFDRDGSIDFENVGCGFNVKPSYLKSLSHECGLMLDGFSHNSGKDLMFVNKDIMDYSELSEKVEEMIPDFKRLADKFDMGVEEIMHRHGFRKLK